MSGTRDSDVQRHSMNGKGKEKRTGKGIDATKRKELALQVCYSCKVRKRKCSKELPACALCLRLFLKCDYEYIFSSNTELLQVGNQHILPSSSSSPLDLSIRASLSAAADLFSALSSPVQNPTSTERPPQAAIEYNASTSIPEEVLDTLILFGENIASVTTSYFQTIDTWMPFIWAAQTQQLLETMVMDNNVSLSCLLLAMFLVTRQPLITMNSAAEYHGAYFKTKALVAALGSQKGMRIETAQASLLLVIYEIGYGMTEQALIGMTTCVGLVRMVIGNPRKLSTALREKSGEARLWRSVVILATYMNIGITEEKIHIAAGILDHESDFLSLALTVGPGQHLEEQRRVWQRGKHPCSGLSAFCRAARSEYLLAKTLNLLSKSAYGVVDEIEFDALDGRLQETVLSLLSQTTNTWEECCPAIRLALSALLSLRERIWSMANGILGKEYRKQAAEIAICSTTRIIIDIAYRFNVDLGFVELSALPLVSLGCIYQAALAHIKHANGQFLTADWSRDLETLRSTLAHFAKRWRLASCYINNIEKIISEEVNTRTRIAHEIFQNNYSIA